MTSNDILKSDVLDILFDDRNKLYGAYVLRKNYPSRLGTALLIAMGSVLFLLFFIRPGVTDGRLAFEKPPVEVHTLFIPPPPPPPPPAPPVQRVAPPPPVAENSYMSNLKMVDNPDPDKEMNSIKEIEGTAIGDKNEAGLVVPEIQVVAKPEKGDGSQPNSSTGEKEKEFVPLESQPEFPGGRDAWVNFLNKHLRTPEDLDAGEKKVVLIRFMVDTDGTVTGFTVVQSGGSAFDNEVIRVLKKMPKWKPAMQNGHPVGVPFTQPVTFVGLEN
jgi:protein TonB